jgi:hypothetical protein
MLKIPGSEADIEALRYWRFHHPDPRVQMGWKPSTYAVQG